MKKKRLNKQMDVVVSWYNEPVVDLPSILPASARIRHYCKGSTIPPGATILPNVGMCDHTYLYHIVQHYDSLAPITVFLPASWNRGWKWALTWYVLLSVIVFRRTSLPPLPVFEDIMSFQIEDWQPTHPDNRGLATVLLPARPRPFGRWFAANFPGEKLMSVVYKGIFAATAGDIQRRPRDFYANLLAQLDHHPRPECAHFVERCWGTILGSGALLPRH